MALVATAIYAFAFNAHAEPPMKNSVLGFGFSASPEEIREMISEKYPDCDIEEKYYLPGLDGRSPLASLQIQSRYWAESSWTACEKRQLLLNRFDDVSVDFLHASVDPASPIISITVERHFANKPLERKHSVADLLQSLVSEYGKPTKIVYQSSVAEPLQQKACNKAKSSNCLHKANAYWMLTVPDKEFPSSYCSMAECGKFTLEAEVYAFGPGNSKIESLTISSVKLILIDHELMEKQDSWRSKRRREVEDSSLQF